ncbi:RNA-directed DNA polymerase, eukaryota [Tanacetum coccineum]
MHTDNGKEHEGHESDQQQPNLVQTNLDRLIGNLCTIWMGRLHLHANPVRFHRDPKVSPAQQSKGMEGLSNNSFASVLKTGSQNPKSVYDPSPAIVLDDSCVVDKDMSGALMGKIKDINALPNLYTLLENEGFEKVNLTYLGGFWVLIDTGSSKSKENKCLPIKTWTHKAFAKIVSPWGSLSEVEDEDDSSLPYKKLCVITKPNILIDNRIKVIVKGCVYWVRVKELEVWSPDFNNYLSDNDTDKDVSDDENMNQGSGKNGLNCESDKDNDVDHVSESNCMKDYGAASENSGKSKDAKYSSEDPFRIYDILNRKPDNSESKSDDPTFPPGFTPADETDNLAGAKDDSIDKPMGDLQSNKEGRCSSNCGNNRIMNIKPGGRISVFKMNILSLNIQGLGQSAKKEWIQEINRKHKVNFITIQETKMENIGLFTVKALWGSLSFDFVFSPSVGSSGGILCVWDPNMFIKDNVSISDSFVAIRGTWVPNSTKLLIVSVYAPQEVSERRLLWEYIGHLIEQWDGECVILGDFNEVRTVQERFGTVFNALGANAFNHFIASASLLSVFPSLSAICLDRHLSYHRPILMREVVVDYGPIPFRIFNSWFFKPGYDKIIEDTWNNSIIVETNSIVLLKKKFKALKSVIKSWIKEEKHHSKAERFAIMNRLVELDKLFDQGNGTKDLVNDRTVLLKDLQDINNQLSLDMAQKAKVRWSIEGDENSKYFHGILNKKRLQLAIRGVLVDGDWIDEPANVKNEFLNHFSNRFSKPISANIYLGSQMLKTLSLDQVEDLERNVTYDEIKRAVWDCGTNKSPGPDGFTFDFIRRYWYVIDKDVEKAVEEFFDSSTFPPGCNASFITLIPKMQDAKLVKDFRPISLIGCIYKIVAKILANRLSLVILELVSDVQSAFVSNRQILDGPFILNELISWSKAKKSKVMIFKVDFEKAFDSVRWDFLDDLLDKFSFGTKWRGWIKGCLNSARGSILVNGSSTSEFKFYKGLKQSDPLSPFLFILVMESLHFSFNHILNAGLFKGIRIDNSLTLSHLFYADDAVFIGKWDKSNLITIVNMLKCFFLASGLKINIYKSKLMGIGVSHEDVNSAANFIGCSTLSRPFNYLGVKVGGCNSRSSSWDEVIAKISSRLSKWKLKTLSIGGRLTLIKSVLSSMPLYHMSIYKVPLGVLNKLESLRRNFFNVFLPLTELSYSNGFGDLFLMILLCGLGSLKPCTEIVVPWIILVFYLENLLGQTLLKKLLPYLLKNVSVSIKLIDSSLSRSFRREPRGGIEEEQYLLLVEKVASVILSNSIDRWIWSLASSGEFSVKSARNHIDDILLPSVGSVTRWVHAVPIKINVFAWKVCLDFLPTRFNLSLRGLDIPSILCPVCHLAGESSSHLFFSCNVARQLLQKIARWWELDVLDLFSYDDWISWFSSLRLAKGIKSVLEGVFYVAWWALWKFRNEVIFGSAKPRLELIFDEVVLKSFSWVSTRCNGSFDWSIWLKCPITLTL